MPDELDYPDGLVGIRTWYIDGRYTHGIRGLACVSDGEHTNTIGVGPDYEVQATEKQLVAWLRAGGFSDLETDVDSLAAEWNAVS